MVRASVSTRGWCLLGTEIGTVWEAGRVPELMVQLGGSVQLKRFRQRFPARVGAVELRAGVVGLRGVSRGVRVGDVVHVRVDGGEGSRGAEQGEGECGGGGEDEGA